MPRSNVWIVLYFLQKKRRVGAYLTASRGDLGDHIFERLSEDADRIKEELGIPVEWTSEDGKHFISSSKNFPDLIDTAYRDKI